MNRDCMGSFFTDLKVYRCLGDGNFTSTNEVPKVCPLCNRPVAAKIYKKTRIRVERVVSIWLPSCQSWDELSRETLQTKTVEVGGTLGYD